MDGKNVVICNQQPTKENKNEHRNDTSQWHRCGCLPCWPAREPFPDRRKAAEQPKNDSPAATPANPTAGKSATPAAQPAQAPTLSAPSEPPAVTETSWLEDETLGLSNRTWCEIIGGIAVAGAAYFVGQYMANKSDDAAPAV